MTNDTTNQFDDAMLTEEMKKELEYWSKCRETYSSSFYYCNLRDARVRKVLDACWSDDSTDISNRCNPKLMGKNKKSEFIEFVFSVEGLEDLHNYLGFFVETPKDMDPFEAECCNEVFQYRGGVVALQKQGVIAVQYRVFQMIQDSAYSDYIDVCDHEQHAAFEQFLNDPDNAKFPCEVDDSHSMKDKLQIATLMYTFNKMQELLQLINSGYSILCHSQVKTVFEG